MILGISALHHDSAVCLTKGSDIVFASGEERFSRVKNDSRMFLTYFEHIHGVCEAKYNRFCV